MRSMDNQQSYNYLTKLYSFGDVGKNVCFFQGMLVLK